ncbi:hypothetical protein [Candidatus Carsonella ruddii]|uniref:Ribosomal protein L17 n=1 Tax=Candidatus Carsonella ruddii PC isolate NHV TaxID=1202540 RepID=J3VR15_CARRU|nr:hypothetical protein [Candidatus Carsonella ruddii]AFP84361.1 ribosomal protein L17 [Candidatus Carsonella ruddii PC isolate NHV]
MTYNFFKIYLKNIYLSLLKYSKIKSNYFKLKKIKKKLIKLFTKTNKKCYLIKLNNRKGDNSIIGEFGIYNYYINKIIK